MPKFKTITLKRSNKAGEEYSEKFEIHVDPDGYFYTAPSEEVLEAAQSLTMRHAAYLKTPRRNARCRLVCPTYEGLEETLKEAIDEMLAVEVMTERVIVYERQADVSVWQDTDGSIHANGYLGNDRGEKGGGWNDCGANIHAGNAPKYFSIGLTARVLDKITYRRPNSERVEFKRPEWGHSHLSFPTWGAKLNGFVVGLPDKPERLESMPYTEEAAKFFYDAMIGIASMGIRLHEFFADEARVQRAIEHGGMPLLAQAGGSQDG